MRRLSLLFMGLGLVLLGLVYGPILLQEFHYLGYKDEMVPSVGVTPAVDPGREVMVPLNTTFAIVIPKIRANAAVIADVYPFNPEMYQPALARGVAHASGSALPGNPGNMFLFSHSSVSLVEARKYNSVFYLLHRLDPGDEIVVFYQGNEHRYRVSDKHIIEATDLEWIYGFQPTERLILMTCWPPGTDWRRLIVVAQAV